MSKKISELLLDIRDYAYLWEYRQTGEIAKRNYMYKVLPLFGIYYILLMGAIMYCIRAFYYIPLIKQIENSGYFVKMGAAVLTVYLPFRILHFFLDKKFADIPFPDSETPQAVLKRKRKVYWLSFMMGIALLGLLVFITTQIGYVGEGPIFK